MLTEIPRHAPARRRPTLRALWAPLAVTALLHVALLTASEAGVGDSQAQPAVAAMQTRAVPAQLDARIDSQIDARTGARPAPVKSPAAAIVEADASLAPLPKTQTSLSPSTDNPPPEAPLSDQALASASPPPGSAALPSVDNAPVQLAANPVDADLVKNVAAPAGAADMAIPVYRTVMPPPATMRYDLRKGFIPGSGELVWKPAGDRYEARLEGSVAGMNLLTQTSIGMLDAHGIAPSRFTDARSRRGTNAANFQRDKGKITYSGPQLEYPLVPGTQDRVSWMIQIGAILNADPKLAAPDGKIVMFVSGANGDADVWVFRYAGAENLRTDSGPLRTVKFTREPRKAYDRSVEVWLAPTRNHLPIRARFTANAGGDAFELLLRDIQSQ